MGMEALPVRMKRLCALLLAVVLTVGLCSCSIGKRGKYEKAVEAVRNGHYTEAIERLEALEGYEDSAKYIAYARAIQAGDSGDYEAAITALKVLNGFEKSAVYITSYTTLAAEAEQARIKSAYDQAISDVRAGKYAEAIAVLESLNDYEDSAKYIAYARAIQAGDSGDYEAAIEALEALNGFEKSAVYITSYTALAYEAEQVRIRSAYNQAIADVMAGRYDEAISTLETLNGYEDSSKYIMYARSLKAGDSGDYETAIKSLSSLGYFKETGMYIQYYTALRYEAEQKYEEAGEVYDGILLFKDVQARKAALPDKILDRDLAEAERALEQEYDWSPLREMVQKKYTTSETRMYENILAYAEQLHERQAYKNAMKVCMLLLENGYKKAETGLKKSAYQLAREWMADGAYADARYIINEYIPGYKDTDEMVKECDYQLALKKQAGGAENARAAYNAFKALGNYRDSAARAAAYETKYAEAVAKREANDFDGAIALFSALGTYSDSATKSEEAQNAKAYADAVSLMNSEKYEEAIKAFRVLNGYSDSAAKIEACETAILEREYQKGVKLKTDEKYEEAIEAFRVLNGYSDSAEQIEACETAILEREYQKAIKLKTDEKYEEAIEAFRVLNGYSDSAAQIEACETAILEREYQKAIKLADEGKRNEAIRLFRSLNGYKDSNEQIRYQQALQAESEGAKHAQTAYDAFKALGTYKDSAEHAAAYETKYAEAISKRESGDFDVAIALFTELGTFSDSVIQIKKTKYAKAVAKRESGDFDAAIALFTELGTYLDSVERMKETKYAKAVTKRESGDFDAAIALFTELGTYSDSAAQIKETQNAKAYAAAVSLMNDEKYEAAINAFRALNGYSDSTEQITECTYRTAEKLRESGKYAEAYAIYLTIREYKDVEKIIANDAGITAMVAARIAEYQPGNYVTFGTYPQTKFGTNKTPIEWLVLESDGETALLISRYALDCQPYNNKWKDITWERCTLRSWLNNEFYNCAFSAEEKKSILVSNVSADKNPSYSTNPGNATKDSVFLLSIVEANKYFANDEARMCAVTDYAIEQGAWTSDSSKVDGRPACWWWLRSPGYNGSSAALVFHVGSIYDYGGRVDLSDSAVRPCVWVRLF